MLAGCALALNGALCGFLIKLLSSSLDLPGPFGCLPIGLLLGIFAFQAGQLSANSQLTVLVFPVLVMLVPILDTSIVTATRLATGARFHVVVWILYHHRLLWLRLPNEG